MSDSGEWYCSRDNQFPCVLWGNLRLKSCELVMCVCVGGDWGSSGAWGVGLASFDLLLFQFFKISQCHRSFHFSQSWRILWAIPIWIVIYVFINIKVKRSTDWATETFIGWGTSNVQRRCHRRWLSVIVGCVGIRRLRCAVSSTVDWLIGFGLI